MGGASQGTPTPMMSPAPPGGPQDMAGYGMGINGSDYGSQPYNDGSMGYDPMHQVSPNFAPSFACFALCLSKQIQTFDSINLVAPANFPILPCAFFKLNKRRWLDSNAARFILKISTWSLPHRRSLLLLTDKSSLLQ